MLERAIRIGRNVQAALSKPQESKKEIEPVATDGSGEKINLDENVGKPADVELNKQAEVVSEGQSKEKGEEDMRRLPAPMKQMLM